MDDFHLLVDMQHIRHLGLEARIPPLHVVSNLVRPKFALAQDLVKLGAAQFLQRRMPGYDAMSADVGGQ